MATSFLSHLAHRGYELCFADEGCCILNSAKKIACISHLHSNLYHIDIKVTGGENTGIACLDSLSWDGHRNKVGYTLTVRTSIPKASVATWHHHLSRSQIGAVKYYMSHSMTKRAQQLPTSTLAPLNPSVPIHCQLLTLHLTMFLARVPMHANNDSSCTRPTKFQALCQASLRIAHFDYESRIECRDGDEPMMYDLDMGEALCEGSGIRQQSPLM